MEALIHSIVDITPEGVVAQIMLDPLRKQKVTIRNYSQTPLPLQPNQLIRFVWISKSGGLVDLI